MKKINWLYLIAIIALVSCSKGKPRTAISVAQLYIDTIFEKARVQESDSTLQLLWDFDEKLYKASNKSKKFIVTRKVNPCCPCNGTDPMCCACLVDTEFASMSDMQANLSLDGADMKVAGNPVEGVDLFAIPRGTSNGRHQLKISTAITQPITYTISIEPDGTIRF